MSQENNQELSSDKNKMDQAGEDISVEEVIQEEVIKPEELDTVPVEKAQEWIKANKDNLKYLNKNNVQKLESIINNPEKINAASLAELREIQEELEKELREKFNRRFNEVKSGLVNLREEMFKIPNYENLPDELQEVALNTFTNCELRLSNTNSIDALKEIFDNFANNVYPDLSAKIYALENPNVFPLNLTEILDSMPRLTFNNEEELETALSRLREAAIEKLKKSQPKDDSGSKS